MHSCVCLAHLIGESQPLLQHYYPILLQVAAVHSFSLQECCTIDLCSLLLLASGLFLALCGYSVAHG